MDIYWLRIYPSVFLWNKKQCGFMYDTEQNKGFEFANSGVVKQICNKLNNVDNLYCVEIAEKYFNDSDFTSWVYGIVKNGMGSISEKRETEVKPISLPPILNLYRNIRRGKRLPEYVGRRIQEYLHEVVIYLNGCKTDKDYAKQFVYKPNCSAVLPIEKLQAFLVSLSHKSVIRLAGDNIFGYPEIASVVDMARSKSIKLYCHITCKDIIGAKIPNPLVYSDVAFNVLCNITDNTRKEIGEAIQILNSFNNNIKWEFIVESDADCKAVDEIVRELSLGGSSIILTPFFTGDNLLFFEKNVFLTKEDVQALCLSKRNVFAHQILNTNKFGKLTIFPNGEVYANINHPPIGMIDTPINDMIYKELSKGVSWLDIRDQEPCESCVYQWLCPSPTNYEIAMKRANSCSFISIAEVIK